MQTICGMGQGLSVIGRIYCSLKCRRFYWYSDNTPKHFVRKDNGKIDTADKPKPVYIFTLWNLFDKLRQEKQHLVWEVVPQVRFLCLVLKFRAGDLTSFKPALFDKKGFEWSLCVKHNRFFFELFFTLVEDANALRTIKSYIHFFKWALKHYFDTTVCIFFIWQKL